MRASSCFTAWLAVLASGVGLSSASLAYVLTFDPQTAQAKHQTALSALSPEQARLVIAQRVGAEDYHITSTPSDAEIELINKYGARSSIFDFTAIPERALLVAELPMEHDSHTKLRPHARFTIRDSPDLPATEDLLQDLFRQTHSHTASRERLRSADFDLEIWPIFHVADDADKLIKKAQELAAEGVAVTALLVPAGKSSTQWGTYSMPQKALKRQSRLEHELPMEEEMPVLTLASNSSNSTSNYTRPLKGILPACFSSQKKCEDRTMGCTGHGQCKLKYTDKSHPAGKAGECWSCSCTPTKTKGKTTTWAGPACQKKDISVEFWLIALFSIALAGLVSFAVGNLWSMGEQELPSVIGAGVSGPTARK